MKEKRVKQEMKKKYDERKELIEDTKKQKLEELQAKRQEEEEDEKQRLENQAKQLDAKEFMKKQKEKLELEF
ncbi:hypothetical protein OXYTRIMIC_133 [Oxytricha trifallax]|uniref:Uncharacterized protein n=1 Tax=Oxytricha trifallax TaxID=1172189 RepID=A0A073IBL5_9SPIT|nr:hypothetical protein OXYTRIMIC_133 [Oxytricha trifallax]